MSRLPVIFLAFANDKQSTNGFLRNLTEERNAIRSALHNASVGQNPVCEVIVEPDVSVDKIFSTFQDDRYRDRIAVFHYGGHADDYTLLLENSLGIKSPARAEGLIPFLADQESLKLIFLNGCSTQQQAVDLVAAGTPAVIGTSGSVPDTIAQIIAAWFYRGLGAGLSVERAWREADQRVRTEHGVEIHSAILAEPGLRSALPWDIRYTNSNKLVKEWNLPDAAQNPVFGLPEIDTKYYLQLPASPFLGLRRFENQHAGIFFGRNSEIRKLIDKINGIYPVILYYGLSGVGKSSLLEAGLIPRIEKSYTVKAMRRINDVGLFATLKTGLKEIIDSARSNTALTNLNESILSYWKLVEEITGKPLLFILDQTEESYTKPMQGEQDEWDTFCTEIKPLANHLGQSGSGKLVLSFRSEYLPQIQNNLYNHTIPKTDLLLLPLNKTGIKEAILGVIKNEHTADHYKLSGNSIEEELAEEIAYDLSADKNSPVAPMLQVVMAKLWERVPVSNNGQREIHTAIYYQIRDEGIALSDFVNERLAELTDLNTDSSSVLLKKDVEKSGLVLDILMQFVTPRNTADAFDIDKIIALYPHHKDILKPLLGHLIDARLLTTFSEEQKGMIGLSHDTLAPVIRELYERSDRPGQRARRILEGKIGGGQGGSILDDVDLSQVEKGVEGMRSWTAEEQQLIASSRVARLKRMQQLRRRRVLMISSVVTIFLFGIVSLLLWQEAKKKTVEAQANSLAARAQVAFSSDHTLGVNLALEALKRQINRETGLALSSTTGDADAFYQVSFVGHKDRITSVAFSPDGKYVLTGSFDKTAKLWNLEGIVVDSFVGHQSVVLKVAFSPDGKYVFTGGFDNTARIWNLDGSVVDSLVWDKRTNIYAFSPDGKYVLSSHSRGVERGELNTAKLWTLNGKEEQSFVGHKDDIYSGAFSPDGKYVLTGSRDGSAKLWTMDGTEVASIVSQGGSSVAFSQDGKYVLTGNYDGTAKLWNLNGSVVQSFVGHKDLITSLVFSPDGNNILTGSADGTAKLWDLNGNELQSFMVNIKYSVSSVAFSPDGKSVLTGSADGTAKLFSLYSEREQFFCSHNNNFSLAFSPDGEFVLTGGNRSAKLWKLDGSEVKSFEGDKYFIFSVAFSPDGKYILTGSLVGSPNLPNGSILMNTKIDGIAKLWTLDGVEVASFMHCEAYINSVAFSPDGKYVLTGSSDSTAKLWTLEGKEVHSYLGHLGSVSSVAFSPDGKYILTGSSDKSAKLWTLEGREVHSYIGHLGSVSSVAFSPDGKYILTGSSDKTAKLWTLEGREVNSYIGILSRVVSIAFSPDGKYVLIGYYERPAKLWTLNGIEVQSFASGRAIFSPDGRYILTGDPSRSCAELELRWDYYLKEGILAPLTEDQKREYGIK